MPRRHCDGRGKGNRLKRKGWIGFLLTLCSGLPLIQVLRFLSPEAAADFIIQMTAVAQVFNHLSQNLMRGLLLRNVYLPERDELNLFVFRQPCLGRIEPCYRHEHRRAECAQGVLSRAVSWVVLLPPMRIRLFDKRDDGSRV